MTTKARLIEKINSIDNESHLGALLKYLEESEKARVQLTEKDIEEIKLSEHQFENGMFLNQKDLRSKFNKWLEK